MGIEVLPAIGRWEDFASFMVPRKPGGGGCVCMAYRNSSLDMPGRIGHMRDLRWDTKPDNRIRRTSSHPAPTRFEELLADVSQAPSAMRQVMDLGWPPALLRFHPRGSTLDSAANLGKAARDT